MPLVMRYPALIPAGQVVEEMVMNLDFAPTFLDFAQIAVPEDMQGVSLRPIVIGKKAPADWRDAVYYHYYEYPGGWHDVRRHFGVRTDRYKLINFYNDRYWELFDLEKDPKELTNVYNDPAYKDIVKDMKTRLENMRTFYGDHEY